MERGQRQGMTSPQPLVSSVRENVLLTVSSFRFFICFSFSCNREHPSRPHGPKTKVHIQAPWCPPPQTKADRTGLSEPSAQWASLGVCSSSLLCMTEEPGHAHVSHRGQHGRTFLPHTRDLHKGNNMTFLAYFSKQTSKLGCHLISY